MLDEAKVLQARENDPLKTPERKRKRDFDETILWAPKRPKKPLKMKNIPGRTLFFENGGTDREVDMTFLETIPLRRSLFRVEATPPDDSENKYKFT